MAKLEEYGYIEGHIRSEKGQVSLSHDHFTSDDFVDGVLTICIEKNHNFAMGSDVIHIENIPLLLMQNPMVCLSRQYVRLYHQQQKISHEYLSILKKTKLRHLFFDNRFYQSR